MHPRHVALLTLALAATLVSAQTPYKPTPQQLLDGYKSADEFQTRSANAVFGLEVTPNWFGGHYFWYVKNQKDRVREFVLVDTTNGKKQPAFDAKRLAAALEKKTGEKVDPLRLPFESIQLSDDLKTLSFESKAKAWKVDLGSYEVTGGYPVPQRNRQGQRPRGQDGQSPDGNFTARIEGGQVQIRAKDGDWKTITKAGDYSQFNWAPDSNHLMAFRLLPGDRKPVYLLKSSVPGTTRAVLESRLYDQPGDKLDEYEAYVLSASGASEQKVPMNPIMGGGQPWSSPPGVNWWQGGKTAVMEFTIRGYQEQMVVGVDLATGNPKTLVDEKAKTFIDQGRVMLRLLDNGKEFLWRSERDGWGHLYLYNVESGSVTQVTKGEWVVRSIERIDNEKRQVWFTANGIAKDQDPYHMHYCRVDLDGKNLVDLTPGDGTHTVQFSPDQKFYVDTYSRIDMAPVHELRSSADGKLISVIEKADISGLLKNGVKLPERFVAKARDGKTDIWGIIIRPTNFDPKKKYPVIENIYAGPHDSFVPKRFYPILNMQRLAELGFIVVQIDGMGTNNRGKAFHDVCWKNIADAGFPDRILWMKAMAAKYKQADIERVGVYGTSAGGQNSTAALLFHPEFYKVAVSSCGCHDNRIDKQWWNEQWMGYPVGPHYDEQSNITNAAKLKGHLFLFVGEQDRNVPPESTIRLVDALMKAKKEFDFMIFPGFDHTDGGPYGERKRRDYFVRWLLGVNPPEWNTVGN